MRSNRAASFRALSVLALALVGVVLVAGISPGATRFLTKKKALKLFYTKAKADERYALKGAPASDVACSGCVGENELGFDPATQAELNSAVTVEAWREVGAPGQPGFFTSPNPVNCSGPGGQCWDNFDSSHNSAAFFKDPFGVVHLKGLVKCLHNPTPTASCVGGGIQRSHTIFVLPSGYRPALREVHATLSSDGSFRVNIDPGGEVRIEGEVEAQTDWVSLDGITFRAV